MPRKGSTELPDEFSAGDLARNLTLRWSPRHEVRDQERGTGLAAAIGSRPSERPLTTIGDAGNHGLQGLSHARLQHIAGERRRTGQIGIDPGRKRETTLDPDNPREGRHAALR